MAEADLLQQKLLQAQNRDGGWGYQKGSSWTEPTALALLALTAQRGSSDVCTAGTQWLVRTQREDGGWAPQVAVEQSTWVTSLAALALAGSNHSREHHRRSIAWLVRQIQPGDSPLGIASRLSGVPLDPRPAGGSPWYPGTAAWVGPTAFSILALSHSASGGKVADLMLHVRDGQEFLLSRRCHDGGWNHGGSKYRSDNASSYPEMTGLALLALKGADPSKLQFPLERAREFVSSPTSLEALSWLQLGLLAQGRDYPALQTNLPCRTVRDICLRLLALAGNCDTNKLLMA